MEVKRKLSEFLKRETVLTVAILLTIVSAVMIPPDREYAGYIDFRTLSILFCLMTVMAGLQKLGVFRNIAKTLLRHTQNTIQLAEVLVLLCFIFSMIITNDVSLITFVPFTFIVLRLTGEEAVKKLAVPVIVLQTIAANLGSMLTPIGNPQNLYLYGKTQMSVGTFILLMLPYSLVSLLLLMICVVIVAKRSGIEVRGAEVLLTEDEKEIFTSGIFAVICVVSADCGSYDSLSGDIGNCGIGGSPFRSWYSYKSGLFAFADVCGFLYFYRKYGKNACFL